MARPSGTQWTPPEPTLTNLGTQYVDVDGNDNNNGWTSSTAKKTIEAAIGDLTLGAFLGSRVVLGQGNHPFEDVDVPNGVDIVGQGRYSTSIIPLGNYAIKYPYAGSFSGFNKLSNLKINAAHNQQQWADFEGRAVWIQSERSTTISDVWFHFIGEDWSGSADLDVAPCSIYLEGVTDFTDWHKFDRIDILSGYRGIVNAGNSQFKLSNSDLTYQRVEAIYNLRRDVGFGVDGGGAMQIDNSYFVNHTQESDYIIFSDFDSTGGVEAFGVVLISNSHFERTGAFGVQAGHIYNNMQFFQLSNTFFSGGSATSDPTHAVFFGDDAVGGMCRGWIGVKAALQTVGAPTMAGNTAANDVGP